MAIGECRLRAFHLSDFIVDGDQVQAKNPNGCLHSGSLGLNLMFFLSTGKTPSFRFVLR